MFYGFGRCDFARDYLGRENDGLTATPRADIKTPVLTV
jgi:hypothetical protein